MNQKSKPIPIGALRRPDSAQYLGVSIRKLDQLAETGQLTRVKIDRVTVFLISDLDEFLASRRTETD